MVGRLALGDVRNGVVGHHQHRPGGLAGGAQRIVCVCGFCQAQPKLQLNLSWAEFSFILTKIHHIACATRTT